MLISAMIYALGFYKKLVSCFLVRIQRVHCPCSQPNVSFTRSLVPLFVRLTCHMFIDRSHAHVAFIQYVSVLCPLSSGVSFNSSHRSRLFPRLD